MIVDLVVTESSGEQRPGRGSLGHSSTAAGQQARHGSCGPPPLHLGRARRAPRGACDWPLTYARGPTRARNGRQHLSVWSWGCCRRDGNGKRGQTTLHRITPFFSWASASSRGQGLAAWPPPWHSPDGKEHPGQPGPPTPSNRSPRAHAFPPLDQQECSLVAGGWHILLCLPPHGHQQSVTGPNRYFLRCATAAHDNAPRICRAVDCHSARSAAPPIPGPLQSRPRPRPRPSHRVAIPPYTTVPRPTLPPELLSRTLLPSPLRRLCHRVAKFGTSRSASKARDRATHAAVATRRAGPITKSSARPHGWRADGRPQVARALRTHSAPTHP